MYKYALLTSLFLMGCSGSSMDDDNSQDMAQQDDSSMQSNDMSGNDASDNSMEQDTSYECGNNDHPMVGKMAIFDTHAHMVAGQMTIVDNCTFELTAFTYDGGGPSVYFYGGNDLNFNEDAGGFGFGPMLNGTVYDNDTFQFTVNDPTILDRMNSVSVWCYDFQVSFGDGEFL